MLPPPRRLIFRQAYFGPCAPPTNSFLAQFVSLVNGFDSMLKISPDLRSRSVKARFGSILLINFVGELFYDTNY